MMMMMMMPVFSACPKNTYKSGSSECSNCPINSETAGEASSRTDCRCKTGFTGTPGQTCTGTYLHVTLSPDKPALVGTNMLHLPNMARQILKRCSYTLSKEQKIRVISRRSENTNDLLQWLSMRKQILKPTKIKRTFVPK